MQLTGVGEHIPSIPCKREPQLHILADQAVQHLLEVFDQRVGVQDHGLEHLLAAERQELLRERCRSLRSLPHLGEIPLGRAVRRQLFAQNVDVAKNRCEDVVEIVRHAAGEPADRLHFLRLPQLTLELLALRDVLEVEEKMRLTGERDDFSGQKAGARLARAGQPLHLDIAEDTPGSELRQHLLPLLVAPPDAQLVAGAVDRLGPVHAKQPQQAFVHLDPAGVGQPADGHR